VYLREKEKQLREERIYLLREEEQLPREKYEYSGESHTFWLAATLALTWSSR
jgi:hypothetical protein